MNLGQFIRHLEIGDPAHELVFDFPDKLPTTFASYRGYYDQLALGHGGFFYEPDFVKPTVGSVLEMAQKALGATFEGWKGGMFTMDDKTKLWVDNPGSFSSVKINQIEHTGYQSVIHTRFVDQW